MNKLIINRLKEQSVSLSSLKFNYGDDVNFLDWVNKTKLFILFLSFEKKDEYLRKQLISMLEISVKKVPVFEVIEILYEPEKFKKAKQELVDLVKLFAEMLELREENLGNKESEN